MAPAAIVTPKLIADLNEGRIVDSSVGATITTVSSATFRQFAYELSLAAVQGRLKPTKFTVAIRASGQVGTKSSEQLADVFWLLWLELEASKGGREQLIRLVLSAMEQELVSQQLLMETGEIDFLEGAGMVKNAGAWRGREIRLNTRQVYSQERYNLLREESEGYAKMITAINGQGKGSLRPELVPAVVKYLQCLIGYFQLDPNRVLDGIMEGFETQPDNPAYLQLLPHFAFKNTAWLLGFKLEGHHGTGTNVKPTPPALMQIAAALIQAGHVTLDELYVYLSPSDGDLAKCAKQAADVVRAKGEQTGRWTEASVVPITVGFTPSRRHNTPSATPPLSISAALELDMHHLVDLAADVMPRNSQKLMLVQGMLKARNWDGVQHLAGRLESLGIQPAAELSISEALCAAVAELLAPEYAKLPVSVPLGKRAKLVNKRALHAAAEAVAFPTDAVPLLCLLGPYLHKNVPLLMRVVRLLKQRCHATKECDETQRDVFTMVEELMSACLLPSLQFIPANPAVGAEVWALLEELPYVRRYRVYSAVAAAERSDPLLTAISSHIRKQATPLIAKLCPPSPPGKRPNREEVKDMKKVMRGLGKISLATPLPLLEELLLHAEKEGVIVASVDNDSKDGAGKVESGSGLATNLENLLGVVRFLGPLGTDMLSWMLLQRLSCTERPSLGSRPAGWAVSLATVSGQLCKKYPAVECRPLLQQLFFLMQRAVGGDETGTSVGQELLMLQHLLEALAGVSAQDGLSVEQAEVAGGGGELLRTEVASLKTRVHPRAARALQRSSKRLLEALEGGGVLKEGPLCGPMLLALARCSAALQWRPERGGGGEEGATRRAVLAGAVDRVNAVLQQYATFLLDKLGVGGYLKLLPPVAELWERLKLNPEIIFHLWRPGLAGLAITDEEDSDDEKEGAATATSVQAEDMYGVVARMLPESTWQAITPQFYTTFWVLQLGDIFSADRSYKEDGATLSEAVAVLEKASGSHSERAANKQEAERLREVIKKLPVELEAQRLHVRKCSRNLQLVKDGWFTGVKEHKRSSSQFLQSCVLPRALFSPQDALYSARFIEKLNRMKTPCFSMVLCYDQCAKYMAALLPHCTPTEAANAGIFMAETFAQLEQWRDNENLYNVDCGSSPGFLLSISASKGDQLEWTKFKRMCLKWQNVLLKQVKGMVSSGDLYKLSNALAFLEKAIPTPFPKIRKNAQLLKNALKVELSKPQNEPSKPALSRCLHAMDAVADGLLVADADTYLGIASAPVKPQPPQPDNVRQVRAGSRGRSSREPSPNRGGAREPHRVERDGERAPPPHPPTPERLRSKEPVPSRRGRELEGSPASVPGSGSPLRFSGPPNPPGLPRAPGPSPGLSVEARESHAPPAPVAGSIRHGSSLRPEAGQGRRGGWDTGEVKAPERREAKRGGDDEWSGGGGRSAKRGREAPQVREAYVETAGEGLEGGKRRRMVEDEHSRAEQRPPPGGGDGPRWGRDGGRRRR